MQLMNREIDAIHTRGNRFEPSYHGPARQFSLGRLFNVSKLKRGSQTGSSLQLVSSIRSSVVSTHPYLPNNDLGTDLEVSRTHDETIPGLDKLSVPSGRWDDTLELFRLQIDRLVQVVTLVEHTEASLRTGTEIQQDLVVSSSGRPECVTSVDEEGEEE